MRILIKSRRRLGDTLLCFPAAQYLVGQGHQVWVECPELWRPIFQWVSYVQPWSPNSPPPDQILDTNICDMTACGSTLINHIPEWFPLLAKMPKGQTVQFDRLPDVPSYDLPSRYILICPFGYSQFRTPPPEWIIDRASALFGSTDGFRCLTDAPRGELPIPSITAASVAHLPHLLQKAEEVVTINSSPNIICSAVRNSHFLVWDDDVVFGRTNYQVPHQVVLHYRGTSKNGGRTGIQRDTEPGSTDAQTDSVCNSWRSQLGSFIQRHSITSVLEFSCASWNPAHAEAYANALYYGADLSAARIACLRRHHGTEHRIFYTIAPEDPAFPNKIDLAVIVDLLGRVEIATLLAMVKILCRQRYCMFVAPESQELNSLSHALHTLGMTPLVASDGVRIFLSTRKDPSL